MTAWGNPLREDDGVAWHVIEVLRRLQRRPSLRPAPAPCSSATAPELAEPVSYAAGVVFVDARRDGTPGQVSCEAVTASAGQPAAHSLSPRALLLYAESLYGRAPQAVEVDISGERFGMGEGLSPRSNGRSPVRSAP